MVYTAEDSDLAEKEFTLGKDREVFYEREGQNERPAIHGWSLAGVEGGRGGEKAKRYKDVMCYVFSQYHLYAA